MEMIMRKIMLALVALLCLQALPALAQSPNTDTYFYTPGGGGVNGALGMCLNASNKAVPCNAANVLPSPVTVGPFPSNTATGAAATPITASATGSTGAISATLAAAAGKFTYLCGFNYQGSQTTAAVSANIVVTGTVTATMNFGFVNLVTGAASPQPPPVIQNFTPCVPSSAVNTPIVVTPPTLGAGATLATVSVWGFQL
jgi:hypothetical protein